MCHCSRRARQGRNRRQFGPHSADIGADRPPSGHRCNPFCWSDHAIPLVVDALREQLVRVLEWYRQERPAFAWGAVIHRRNERGKLRFGAVTPAGESLLLSQPLLASLAEGPCWLDGAVRVRLTCRQATRFIPGSTRCTGLTGLPWWKRWRCVSIRMLPRRMRKLSGHGRDVDPRNATLRAVSPPQEAILDWPCDTVRYASTSGTADPGRSAAATGLPPQSVSRSSTRS